MRRAFAVYLVSHNRPMAEVLSPTRKPLNEEVARGFAGMTASAISLEELESTRDAMIASLVGNMPDSHRRFLKSFELGDPDWPLLGLPEAQHLPAVVWRQQNLNTLNPAVRRQLANNLEAVFAAHPL